MQSLRTECVARFELMMIRECILSVPDVICFVFSLSFNHVCHVLPVPLENNNNNNTTRHGVVLTQVRVINEDRFGPLLRHGVG